MPDKVGRYGGEEFLIVLPHTALAPGRQIAERVRSAVGKAAIEAGGGKRLSLTVSIGVTQFRKGEDLEQLLARAPIRRSTRRRAQAATGSWRANPGAPRADRRCGLRTDRARAPIWCGDSGSVSEQRQATFAGPG